jgi:MFS family permease
MTTLFFIVFLDLVGFGMIIPVLPFFAERMGVPEALVIFLFGLYSLGQLVGAPLWGVLSDRIGRRPVLLGTLVGNAAANMLLATAHDGWQLGLSRLAAGLAAGNISTAYAYVTDISDDAARPRMLGYLGAAFGLGFIVGPALGGLMAGGDGADANLARTAHVAAIMSLVAAAATFILLKESHGPAHRAHAAKHPRANHRQMLRRPVLRELLAATLVIVAGVAMMQSTYVLWGASELSLGPRDIGLVFGVIGVIAVVLQGAGIGPLNRRFGARRLTKAGGVLCTLALALLPLTHSLFMSMIPLAIYAVGGAIFMPSISSLVSHTAGSNERGAVMGVFQSSSALGRVLGPFIASAVAALLGLRWPFVVGAIASLGGVALLHHAPVATHVEDAEAMLGDGVH